MKMPPPAREAGLVIEISSNTKSAPRLTEIPSTAALLIATLVICVERQVSSEIPTQSAVAVPAPTSVIF